MQKLKEPPPYVIAARTLRGACVSHNPLRVCLVNGEQFPNEIIDRILNFYHNFTSYSNIAFPFLQLSVGMSEMP
ncbi:MAG: hypothetical protein ACP5TE_14180 [Verrucomicrobiia bacterium]